MTDKRTKAELAAEIDRLLDLNRQRLGEIGTLNQKNDEFERECDHFRAEAERLAEYAADLERQVIEADDKLGEALEAARYAVSGAVQVFTQKMPRRVSIQDSLHWPERPKRASVRPFENLPF